ncbi:S23-interacting protein, partial [Gonapodya sp. JEL0774]
CNDICLDVVMYFNPVLGSWLQSFVCDSLNERYQKFVAAQPGGRFDGLVVLVGYSLGGVISFELLQKQRWDVRESLQCSARSDLVNGAEKHPNNVAGASTRLNRTTSSPVACGNPPSSPTLLFRPRILLTMGSPIGAVQVARSEHKDFERKIEFLQTNLGVRFLNIFATNDPMGYRCEPLLSPSFKQIPPVTLPEALKTPPSSRFPTSTVAVASTSIPSMTLKLGFSFSTTVNIPAVATVPAVRRAITSALEVMAVSASASVNYLGTAVGSAVKRRWSSTGSGLIPEQVVESNKNSGKRKRSDDEDDESEVVNTFTKRFKIDTSTATQAKSSSPFLSSIASNLRWLTGFKKDQVSPTNPEFMDTATTLVAPDIVMEDMEQLVELSSNQSAGMRCESEEDGTSSDAASESESEGVTVKVTAALSETRLNSSSLPLNSKPGSSSNAVQETVLPQPQPGLGLARQATYDIIPPSPRLDYVVPPDYLFRSFAPSPRNQLMAPPGYFSAARDYLTGIRAHFCYWRSHRVAAFLVDLFGTELHEMRLARTQT